VNQFPAAALTASAQRCIIDNRVSGDYREGTLRRADAMCDALSIRGIQIMKKNATWLVGITIFLASLCLSVAASAQVTLEVMNPRGEIPPPPTIGINQRVPDLGGKKIVLIDNGKFGANNFLDVIAGMLKQKYPTATIVMYPKPSAQTITDMPKWYPTVKQQGDLFIFGVGD
jgi:hypothetical protein